MNLFVVASTGDPPVRPLTQLLSRMPFFEGRRVHSWVSPERSWSAAWVNHAPGQIGDVTYARARRDLLALWSGRPFVWTGDAEADGQSPLDAGFWLERTDFSDVDGRFVAVRVDDFGAQVVTDQLGAYPVYETDYGGVEYVSNSAELLRSIAGTRELDLRTLAHLLGGGWSLDGHPMWAAVRRRNVPGGGFEALLGQGFDAERAAARLAAAMHALADWPGRPSVVPVTGGRDSRLVLAAALAAGIDFETRTGGRPGDPDVEIGRELAEAAGVFWRLLEHDPHGSVASDWRRAAELLDLTCSGTASLSDAAGFPFGPRGGPLWLWHTGQGGEVARSYYGAGAGGSRGLVDQLYRAFTGRRPGRTEILGEDGRRMVREDIERFVHDELAAGAQPVDVPDLFYLWRRMGTWAGPTHGAVEYVHDSTAPLWSVRLLEDELGLPARDREREVFHLRVLEQLAPQLVDIAFEDGRPWPARRSALALRMERMSTFAGKVRAELRRRSRRAPALDGGDGEGSDPFDATLVEIRDLVLDQRDHPAWAVLDRRRVEGLLGSSAAALDTMSRYYAWRLATVFGVSLSP